MAIQTTGNGRIEDPANDPDIRTLIHVISYNEGRRPDTYLDSRGIPTIGVGFNLERADARATISALGLDYDEVLAGRQRVDDEQIDALLEEDLVTAIRDAGSLVANFDALATPRQIVLVDMAFNLGKTRMAGFRKMIAAVEAENWNEAAAQMIDSRWYRQGKDPGRPECRGDAHRRARGGLRPAGRRNIGSGVTIRSYSTVTDLARLRG